MSASYIVIIIVVVAVAAAAIYFVMRKPSLPELDEEPEPRRLPKHKPRKADAPSPPPAKKKTAPRPTPSEPPVEEEEAEPPSDDVSEREPPPDSDDTGEEEEDEPAAKPATRPPPPPSLPKRARDVKGLRKGLKKVRQSEGLFGRLKALFSGSKELDPGLVEEMEEILISSDVGVKTTGELLADIRDGLEKSELTDNDRVWEALRGRAVELLGTGGGIRNYGSPTVVLMVGVNGTGKTTTIGKLAKEYKSEGRKVLLVAGDTFRAAAVEQLKIWGMRVGCDVFAGKSGADPSSVVYDAIRKADEEDYDLVLVDTAGRLHTNTNLMDELEKMVRTSNKALEGSPHETLLVVDSTTGQNALQQAETFKEALPLTGLVLTKLDGTAKGGIVLAIRAEHDLPVRYIGVGERAEDLRDFDAEEFVEAMLGGHDEASEAA